MTREEATRRNTMQNEHKYIDAVSAATIIAEKHGIPLADLVDTFAEIPAADVSPVRHGRWLCADTDTEQFFLCNRCKKKEYWESNYCPNCGCRMDGGADE